ncbi:hypothetical protein Tco_1321982 [Tanacetum coccineum]
MDDPHLTMEEYIRLEEEKAHKCGKVFNWKTATYEKIRVDDDLHNFSSVEAEFPAIVINDAVAPQDELQCKSQPWDYTRRRRYRRLGLVFTGPRTPDRSPISEGLLDRDLISRDFLGIAPSYTLIRDPILRLCHRLIAYSIVGRSQAPEKVTMTDLFYLRGMDVGSVNVPYLLARYLRLFAGGRKSGAHISGGQFVARLAEHFGLLTTKILGGLTVIAPELPIIDMTELPDATTGAPDDAEDAPIVDEGGQANPAPEQVPQQPPLLPPAHVRTMPQRMSRLEEDVHEIRWGLTEQREVIDAMARDFSRFSTWVTTGLGQMMDRAGVVYTTYAQTHVSYQRRVRQRTGEASTSATQQDPQQPDP